MLEDLSIKNFALIESVNIEFNKGFTVLSGETGAGKSILIGALSFVLGGRAGTEQIRSGTTEASVSATFLLPQESPADKVNPDNSDEEAKTARGWLYLHGIQAEDNRVIIRRIIRDNGKTSAWICGQPVTKNDLSEFCLFLVDIHGQHEHQSLMKVSEHLKYLDSYAGITEKVNAFTALYKTLVEKRGELDSLNTSGKERKDRIDLLEFSINEIIQAQLKVDEDTELEAEESRLSSFEKLYSETETLCELLSGAAEGSVISLVKKLRACSDRAYELDSELKNFNSRIENLFYETSDLSEEIKSYSRSLVFDPGRLAFVHERLSLIYNLKKKYASSVNAPLKEVFVYLENSQKELDKLSNSAVDIETLQKEVAALEKEVYARAKEISSIRFSVSREMSEFVQQILSKLGMKDARFSVSIAEKQGDRLTQKCGPYGMDNIEFLISANPGSPLLPLAKIASGGELSRVMLALKTVFAKTDYAGTMIFDEIDTGIGGEIAVSVGEHIRNLAQSHQILCITHLASIAVFADNQIKIEKGVNNQVTSTQVRPVEGEERVKEIARMLSGDTTSQASLEHARSMLDNKRV